MLAKPWYFIVLHFARFLYFLLGGIRSNPKNMPMSGALIVAPIHLSHLDPPAVACGCNRMLRFMAKEELFKGLMGPLIRSLGAFPVKRGEGDTESIRYTMSALEKGEAVIIFPEGTRGDGKQMGSMSKGVALIAKRTGARVLPVGIVGTHKALPKGASKPKRARMRIIYGDPFTFAEVAGDGKGDRDRFLAVLAERLQSLCAEGGLELKLPSGLALDVEPAPSGKLVD